MRIIRWRRPTAGLALAVLAACSGKEPAEDWSADRFEVAGEFWDGRCFVTLDSQSVVVTETPEPMYEHGNAPAPQGLETHELWCEFGVLARNAVPDRSLWLWRALPAGRPLKPGTYRIVPDAVARGDTTAFEATVRLPQFEADSAWLKGYAGTLTLTQLDSPLIVGKFHFLARRVKK